MTNTSVSISNLNSKMGQYEDKSPFIGLPLEILANLFAYFGKDARKVSRLVCWKWKDILDKFHFKFHGVLNDATYDFIRSSNLKFTTLTVNAFNRTREREAGRQEVESMSMSRNKLALSPENLIFSHGSLQNSSACGVSEEIMAMMLSLNRNVTSLRFRLNSLKNIRSLSIRGLYMPNLTKLEIAFTREIIYENQIFNQLAEIGMPSLSHLIFHVTKFIIFEQDKSGLFYIRLFQFVSHHKNRLTSLEIRSDYYLFFPLLSNARHHILPAPETVLDSLQLDLSQVQLKEFSYLFKKPECNPPYTLGFNLMKSQRHLERLNIEERNDSHLLYTGIQSTIQRNCETLVHFTWRSCRYSDNLSFVELNQDLALLLSRCSQLQSLNLYGFKIHCFTHLKELSTMKSIEIEGDLNANVLIQITKRYPQLEKLRFYHMTPVGKDCYRQLANNLKVVMTMPSLKIINWYVWGLYLHYVPKSPDISVKRGKQGRHYYVITFKK